MIWVFSTKALLTVVGVDTRFRIAVVALVHLVGLESVITSSFLFLVLSILLQDQVASVVVGAGHVGLPSVHRAVHFLVQVVL